MGVRDTAPRPGYRVAPCPANLVPRYVGPKQEVLWIGCSDSGFEETTVLDVPIEQSIVLRGVANMALREDSAAASMMQYAIQVLQVRHIVVCGHYECGIVKASETWRGLKGPWFPKLEELRMACSPALQAVDSEHRDGRFVELNVLEQMKHVLDFPEVKTAVAERGLTIHGIVYSRIWNKAVQLIPDGQESDWLHR